WTPRRPGARTAARITDVTRDRRAPAGCGPTDPRRPGPLEPRPWSTHAGITTSRRFAPASTLLARYRLHRGRRLGAAGCAVHLAAPGSGSEGGNPDHAGDPGQREGEGGPRVHQPSARGAAGSG